MRKRQLTNLCPTHVYFLVDKTTPAWDIRYVGKTVNSDLKSYIFNRHDKGSRKIKSSGQFTHNRHSNRWIRSINFQFGFIDVATYPTEGEGLKAEEEYITLLKEAGCDLTNETKGGEGVSGYQPSRELIDQRVKNRIRYYQEHPEDVRRGWHHTQDAKIKVSKNNPRYWKGTGPPKEVTEKARKVNKERTHSDEEKARRTNSLLRSYENRDAWNKGLNTPEEVKQKQRVSMMGKNVGKKQTLEQKQANSIRGKEQYRKLEVRKAHSQIMINYYKDHPAAMYGHHHDEETKVRLSISGVIAQNRPEVKENNRLKHLGRKQSQETILKKINTMRKNREDRYLDSMNYDEEHQISFAYPCGAVCA